MIPAGRRVVILLGADVSRESRPSLPPGGQGRSTELLEQSAALSSGTAVEAQAAAEQSVAHRRAQTQAPSTRPGARVVRGLGARRAGHALTIRIATVLWFGESAGGRL